MVGMAKLAEIYGRGLGVKQDLGQCRFWLGRSADQVAIVCEWGVTPQGSLRQCADRLWSCGIVPRGVALNKVDLNRQAQETFAGAEFALQRTMSYYSDAVTARKS